MKKMRRAIALFAAATLLAGYGFAKSASKKDNKSKQTSEKSTQSNDADTQADEQFVSDLVQQMMGQGNKPEAKKQDTKASPTAAKKQGAIAVPAPKGVNLEGGADWIPLFIQGIITTNFQQYSGMTVIDRQNADMVKAEQLLSETGYFDEKETIEIGKMTSARLIVTGNIVAKSASYALTFSITDAESGETKATASVPDCPRSALEDGTAANKISYDLMAGYGIALGEDAKTRLTQAASAMTAETSAQASVAKGIAAEKGGSNIEALTYYIQARKSDNKLAEAASRMAGMTTIVTSGNFGANAKNMMKLRNDWDKLLLEVAGLIAANPPEFEVRYFTDVEALDLTEADYENGTMSFRMGAPYLKQVRGAENFKIVADLMCAMWSIEQSRNWGEKINGFPWTYADDIPGNHWLKWANAKKRESFPLTVALLDAGKNPIAETSYTLFVDYDRQYTGFVISSSNQGNQNIGDKTKIVYDTSLKYAPQYMLQKYRAYPSLSALNISDVPVGNADTDKVYVSIESRGGRSVSARPSDAIPMYRVLESTKRLGNSIKIGGFIYDYSSSAYRKYNNYSIWLCDEIGNRYEKCAVDLSETLGFDYLYLESNSIEMLRRCSSLNVPDNVIIYCSLLYHSSKLVLPVNFTLLFNGRPSYYDGNSVYNGSETELLYLFRVGAVTDYEKWRVQCTGGK